MKYDILKNKYYLYVTEFFSGMSLMAVEIAANRLIAPYFSSSQIVWTIIIGTIMIAMALGNVYGGRSADKNPNPTILYNRIVVAAVWIAAIPAVGTYVIAGISALLIFNINHGFLIVAAFITCLVMFVFPVFLLGTVTPTLVKINVDNLDESGKKVGQLGAANTIGSILGTFMPTFLTIPAFGTKITFIIFSGVLLVVALIYFISRREIGVKLVVGIVLFVVFSVFGTMGGFAFWENDLAYEGESVYNYLQVKENDEEVTLSTNVMFGVQSIYKKNGELTGMYYDYALLAPFMSGGTTKDKMDILILGMATGTYAKQCEKYFPNARISGVEIDSKITKLATEYFDMTTKDVVTYDGRAYIHADDKKYDLIMVDAYQDITIPFQMSTREFFTEVKNHLNPRGVMVVNMNMRGDGEDDINNYLSDTIAGVFANVSTVNVEKCTNMELFATDDSAYKERAMTGIEACGDENLKNMMREVLNRTLPYEKGDRMLTDDNAPVELLGMSIIDKLIENEVSYYRSIYNKGGVNALMRELGM